MVKFKMDLHAHAYDFSHFVLSNANKKDYVMKLVNNLFKKGDNLVIGLAEFNNDGRFSKFAKAIKKLPEDYNIVKNGPIILIERKNKKIYFVRVDEIATDKGHVLIVGNNERINSRGIGEILKSAKKHGWIIIASHPMHKFFSPYFLISKLIDGESDISLNEEAILKNKNYFDSIELNSYFPKDADKIERFGKKNKISVVSESDAHTLEEFFNSYFELENLDLTNISKFKKSFRRALKKHIKMHVGKHNFIAGYRHGLNVLVSYFGRKMGLIKDDY